jgi:hypothetical protein
MIYINTYIHTYINTYIHEYTHTHTHKHTHTFAQTAQSGCGVGGWRRMGGWGGNDTSRGSGSAALPLGELKGGVDNPQVGGDIEEAPTDMLVCGRVMDQCMIDTGTSCCNSMSTASGPVPVLPSVCFISAVTTRAYVSVHVFAAKHICWMVINIYA